MMKSKSTKRPMVQKMTGLAKSYGRMMPIPKGGTVRTTRRMTVRKRG